MVRWASKPPAAARVVARPEKKILGDAEAGNCEGQEVGVMETRGLSFVEDSGLGRSRRE
jgi:hypothetical protein